MAGLSITGQMKVGTLQEGFHREFGLSLRIYDGRSFADPNSTLAQVRKKKGSGKALSVAKNMKVGNLEDKFEEEFGLKVQVAGSDDSYLCNNDLTLNGAKHEDERKLNRKSANDSAGVIDSDNGDVAASYDVDALTSSFQDDLQFDIEEWLHEEGAALAIDSYTGIYLGAEHKNDRVIICLTMTYDRAGDEDSFDHENSASGIWTQFKTRFLDELSEVNIPADSTDFVIKLFLDD